MTGGGTGAQLLAVSYRLASFEPYIEGLCSNRPSKKGKNLKPEVRNMKSEIYSGF